MANERPIPADTDMPGGFPETPSSNSLSTTTREFSLLGTSRQTVVTNTTRQGTRTITRSEYTEGVGGAGITEVRGQGTHTVTISQYSEGCDEGDSATPTQTAVAYFGAGATPSETFHFGTTDGPGDRRGSVCRLCASSAATSSPTQAASCTESHQNNQQEYAGRSFSTSTGGESDLTRIETHTQSQTLKSVKDAPDAAGWRKGSAQTDDDLFKALSRRRTSTAGPEFEQDQSEIERLVSRLFGKERQEHSEEEKSRHSGVVFRDLTVKGVGLGASLQPTIGDIVTGLPRFIANLVTKGPKAAVGKPPVRELLSHFDGCVRPGEILLVLGRPGAGCSTFLKAFCNQREGFEDVSGQVTYGGTDAESMAKCFRSDIIYNPENDLHYATLTVRRTLSFALQTRTPGKESRLDGESRADYVKNFTQVASKLLWIEHTMDTKVGNEYIRGVSGGERKRVSIAEALVTRASVQGWDNSSKGLDASTAVEYIKSLRAVTNMANISTAVSLYQAGESLYELVDKVLLIDQGQCLYYGSADHAKQYFLDLGFECPERWTTADFLTSVTDTHERRVRRGWEDRIPRSAEDFANIYRKSEAYKRNLEDIQDFESQLESRRNARHGEISKKTKKNYAIAYHRQVISLVVRQFFVILGDKASLMGKWGTLVFQGLIVGSLFYQLPDTAAGAFTRGGVLFFILLFNALLALAEQTAAYEAKPILLKHRNFSFYRPSAFALAQTVIDIPMVLIQVILLGGIIYWMAGLSATPSQFFISILILWLVTMTTYAFFRALSAVVKTMDDATKVTGIAVQIMVVYTGYLIPPSSMHPWFGWLRWINWIYYSFEALVSNEFYALNMNCTAPYLVPNGPGTSPQYQSCAIAGSSPGSNVVSGAEYINTSFTYTRDHLWRNLGIVCAFFVFFVFLTMAGFEMMGANAGGAAVTVFKRGQVPKQLQKTIETAGRSGGGKDEELGGTNEKWLGRSQTTKEEQREKDNRAMENVAKNESVFTFQNVNYTIPFKGGHRKLLQNVQGCVRPGKLTALVGASGAGKTTLLNALAQRINFGVVSGDFLIDGRPLPKSFQRATGYAEQLDIHEPTATIREALQFSALLRQPKEVSTKDKYAYCETIIELLELQDIAGATIGKVGEGLNPEQRKRLTIGVELASKPELLMFLDEPTSGLDSGAAFNIIRFLRKLADAGQAILCTIHQPSAVLFEQFDDLILLKSGGRVAYAGELGHDSEKLIRYFEGNGAQKCPSKANPAEWMLDVIGAGDPDYKGQDWGDVWEHSKAYQQQSHQIQEMVEKRKNTAHSKNVQDDREYAMPWWTQTWAVVKRLFISYWRTPNYIFGKLFLHILAGLFNCFTFWRLGSTSIDMQSRLFSIFMTLTIAPPLIQQLQPMFLNSRNVFESRESNSKIYSWFAWTTAAVLVEIPYAIFAGFIYFNCWWWGIMGWKQLGFPSGFTFLCLILFELYYVSFGQAIAAFSANELLASILVPVFFVFVVSFCGVVVPPEQLPTFWRSWMYWLTPFHYLIEAFLAVAIHDQPVRCSESEFARFSAPPGQTCETYTRSFISENGGYVETGRDGLCQLCQFATGDEFGRQFSIFYGNIWRDFGICCAFVAFNYLVVFGATWLKFKGKNPLRKAASKSK